MLEKYNLILIFIIKIDYTESHPRNGRPRTLGESARNKGFKLPERFSISFTSNREFYGYATAPNRPWYRNTVDSNVKASC